MKSYRDLLGGGGGGVICHNLRNFGKRKYQGIIVEVDKGVFVFYSSSGFINLLVSKYINGKDLVG